MNGSKKIMNCPLCLSNKTNFLLNFKPYLDKEWTFNIYDCINCNCRFTYKDKSINYHDQLYTDYYQYQRYYKIALKTKSLLINLNRCKNYLSKISFTYKEIINYIEQNLKPKSEILEIGSSTGFLTAYFKSKGYNAWGIDISPKAVDFARDTFGDYYSINPGQQDYDAIYHVGTIGCIDSPREFLKKYLDFLKPGGIMIFNAPNFDSLSQYNLIWVKTPPPDLLFIFSEKTFHTIITSSQFSYSTYKTYQRLPRLFKKIFYNNFYPIRYYSETKKKIINKTLILLYIYFNDIINKLKLFTKYESEYGLFVIIRKNIQ